MRIKKGENINCLHCGKSFYVFQCFLKNRKRKYCSHKCYSKTLIGNSVRTKTGQNAQCLFCGKQFYARKHKINKGEGKYCSRKCSSSDKKGAEHNNWKGNRHSLVTMNRKRKIKYIRNNENMELEHRVNAEKVLGRKLKIGELVHHRNFNSLDNRNMNLLICSLGYHNWLHRNA